MAGFICLQYLYLHNNSLGGAIPQSLEPLKAIEDIDLAHNNRSGVIPDFLGSLLVLRNLNLSFNDLEGEGPVGGVFKNVSALSVSRNNKVCGGIPALQLLACPFEEPRKTKMSLGPALIIPIVCGIWGIIILASAILIL